MIPTDGFDLKAGFKGKESVFTTGPRNGMHKFENALLYTTEADASISDAHLYDIAPTILDLMHVDNSEATMDGKSLLT